MDWGSTTLILAGALAGGLASGLAGFGTAMAGLPFWLAVLQPVEAALLACAGSLVGQLMTFRQIWDAIDWPKARPMLIAGFFGLPIGLVLLPLIPARGFKIAVGMSLITFGAFMLAANGRWTITRGGGGADAGVAFLGGALGGLASLSGPPLTMWASLKGWSKERRRGIFQIFNFSILAAMMAGNVLLGRMSSALLGVLVTALPMTILGVTVGHAIYRRLDDRGFDRLVLALLLAGGAVLIASNL